MSKRVLLASALALICATASGFFRRGYDTPKTETRTTAQTQAIVAATTAFLNSLSADQRQKVLFPFTPQKTAIAARFARTGGPDGPGKPGDARLMHGPASTPDMRGQPPGQHPGAGGAPGRGPGGSGVDLGLGPSAGFIGEQYGRAVWSNFPVGDVPRPGLRLGNLSAAQQAAARHLLKVALSPKGFQKVLDVMGSDQALSESGTPFCSGTGCYTIGVFGIPSTTKPWMLQFGGHHLGLNLTMAGEHGVITPTLTGAQPAVYTSNGKIVRTLAQENDKAFALLNALDETQRKQAILNYEVHDLVVGPGRAGVTIQPEGLKASAMNEKQKAMLLEVILEWVDIVNEAYAIPRTAEIKSGLNDTYFAWSGPTTHEPGKNGSAYYRIQGPRLIIEFSPQGVGGDPTMHVHTMYRDPTNDYGRMFTTE